MQKREQLLVDWCVNSTQRLLDELTLLNELVEYPPHAYRGLGTEESNTECQNVAQLLVSSRKVQHIEPIL